MIPAVTGTREFIARVKIFFRLATEEDLPSLEWWGWFAEHRNIILSVYEEMLRGKSIILVADSGGFPIGQVWIDLHTKKQEGIGILWSVRVIPGLRGCGIGSRLVAAAEHMLRQMGYDFAEIGVELENDRAKNLYERVGYRCIGSKSDHRVYTGPAGGTRILSSDQWLLRKSLARESGVR